MRGSVVKPGRTWSYVVDVGRDPTSGRRAAWKGGFATKHAAEDTLALAVAGRLSGVAEPTGLTAAAFLDRWLAAHSPTVTPTTAKRYDEMVRWWVIPALGPLRLADLNALHVQTLYGDLLSSGGRRGTSLSARTVGDVRRVLRKALNDAVEWELLIRSPMRGVKPPRAAEREMVVWSAEEVRRFLDHVRRDRWEGPVGPRRDHWDAPR